MLHILIVSVLVAFTTAQENIQKPETSFCRRHQHSTCVIDNKLYVNGGRVYYGSNVQADSEPKTNTWLLYGELSNLTTDFPALNSSLAKDRDVPSISGGVLWPDTVNKVFYQYGGEYHDTDPQSFSTLWFYDTIYNTWNRSTSPDASQSQTSWPAFGAGTTTDDGIGYYYGGYLSNTTTPGWSGEPLMLNSVVSYNMSQRTWKNYTYDNTPRAEGSLQYIPAGDQGMLVYFGGVEIVNGFTQYANLSKIHLFDIANNRWYPQTTSGDIPQSRRAFCAGVVWAQDRSSYNIYMFGGIGAESETALGDVWVLSMPSFTWIYWQTTPKATTFPGGKAWASCDVVYGSQMIVMSGYYTNKTKIQCDEPEIGGQHGLALGQESMEKGLPWLGLMPDVTEYRVPDNITAVIGGSTDGKATVKEPAAGWDNSDLSVYFKASYSATLRSATRSIPTTTPTSKPQNLSSNESSNKKKIGAIVGGVLGGVILLLIAILIALRCLKSRRKNKEQETQAHNQAALGIPERPEEKCLAHSMTQESTLHSPHSSYSFPGSSPPPTSECQFEPRKALRSWDQGAPYYMSPVQSDYQNVYFPPPAEPGQSPRSIDGFHFELPSSRTPVHFELEGAERKQGQNLEIGR